MWGFTNWLTRRTTGEYKQADAGVASRTAPPRDPNLIVAARWRGREPDGSEDRLFTVAEMPDGTPQAFYQSTGRNSEMPGRWLPCNGVTMHPHNPMKKTWIDKSKFDGSLSRNPADPARPGSPLHRFGSPEAVEVSKRLASLPVRVVATFANPHSLNDWLVSQGYAKAASHRANVEKFKAAVGTPMPQWDVPDPDDHRDEDLPASGLLPRPDDR